jgi:3,4-dihydroxy 2-butanone 4-phosphate synthase
MIKNRNCIEFAKTFRSPGHIPLIISSQDLLNDRNGHSELIMTLIKKGGLLPIVAASEILDMYSGHSLSYDQAKAFAKSNDLVFLEGQEIEQLLK